MQFEENQTGYRIGLGTGWIVGYAVFTTALFFILNWKHDVHVFVVVAITFCIMVLGELVRGLLR